MKRKGSMQASLSMWLFVAGLLSQNLITPVLCAPQSFEDQKNFYIPDPHTGSPPTGSYGTPVAPTPYHGTPPTGKCDPTPPISHKSPPTHHGGSPHTPTPYTPSPHTPTPSTPSPHTPTPYTPSPHTPSPHTPSPHTPSPHTPTPSTPRGGGYNPSPSPPVVSPPTTPVPNPGTPSVPTPETPDTPSAPPFVPDPNSPCTCDYWKHHPALVWGVVGWFGLGSLGGAFGHSSLPGTSPSISCLDALSNTIPNGYGALYREGTAALLNSVATHKFPYSTQDVRNHFATGLGSNSAAATQAQLFKLANEGKLKSKG